MKREQVRLHCTSQYSGFLVGSFSQAQCHPLPAQQTIFVPTTKIHYLRGCDVVICFYVWTCTFCFSKHSQILQGFVGKLNVFFVLLKWLVALCCVPRKRLCKKSIVLDNYNNFSDLWLTVKWDGRKMYLKKESRRWCTLGEKHTHLIKSLKSKELYRACQRPEDDFGSGRYSWSSAGSIVWHS